MGSLVSPKKPKVKPLPEPPPVEQDLDPEVTAARDRAKRAARASFGRGQTVLTGPGGVVMPGQLGARTVLGG